MCLILSMFVATMLKDGNLDFITLSLVLYTQKKMK